MFGLGVPELIIIAVIILLFWGQTASRHWDQTCQEVKRGA